MSNIQEPILKVGILQAQSIEVELNSEYNLNQDTIQGNCQILIVDNLIQLQAEGKTIKAEKLFLAPKISKAQFKLKNVTIGVGFHWEQKEDQVFGGGIELVIENNAIHFINHVLVEDYLYSVISSEMKASSSLELLKAHAIISRSWVLSQIEKNKQLKAEKEAYVSNYTIKNETIRWYDREDHNHFDVCADDHCQRYQGLNRANTPLLEQAINETRGEVLTFGDTICDARFSKCCGGVSEQFENVWEPTYHPYLESIADKDDLFDQFDLELEPNATKWITTSPDAFCNTKDKKILSQVLNEYDQDTPDFYRWEVSYSQRDIRELVRKKTKRNFGDILDLQPIERGTSGRIMRLKIVGSKATHTYGKELEIRRILSDSHLYSSAFIVKKEGKGKVPQRFILKGAGWGHGVGLCQIGAAVMGAKGYNYNEILGHYFQNAEVTKRY